mmetsp:Transcript_47062/g.102411  ORF Transcript_47062/g.102411 Transcript_47062/m.102411 type:complete len:277 (+) Transcript_47062:24-854(+)
MARQRRDKTRCALPRSVLALSLGVAAFLGSESVFAYLRPRTISRADSPVLRLHASPTPEDSGSAPSLKQALRNAISAEEVDSKAVSRLCEELAAAQPATNVGPALVGDWLTTFSTLGSFSKPKPVPLKALSFGALPNRKVTVEKFWNRITKDTYTLIPAVQAEGSEALAGVALEGPYELDDQVRHRCHVRFTKVTLAPAEDPLASGSGESASLSLCSDIMGKRVGKSQKPWALFRWLRADRTFVDVMYIDDEMRIHKGKSGAIYVLDRVPKVPYLL